MIRINLAILLTLLAAPAWATDVYKWQDATGRTQYTDQAPPPSAKNVQKLKSSAASLTTDKVVTQSYAAQQAASQYPVTLFSFAECGDPCKNAEALLKQRGISYTLKSKDEDKNELKTLTGELVAPTLIVGKQIRKGFEVENWNTLLDAAGYPKTSGAPRAEKKTEPIKQ